ncbi:MAG TPA: YhjD/YihY/BrkB family envelope integrity protein [Candidatus Polarisedimenticolia bacterium]|nr:YhjD/YihY/BrkB family envelope integrity protein [Candidatus Polarisedimenticolia bacterium]
MAPRTSLFAAALAFHALLALAPVLLVLIPTATRLFGEAETQEALADVIDRFAGRGAAQVGLALLALVASAPAPRAGTLFGIALLLYFGSTFFAQFRAALDAIWEAGPQGLRGALVARAVSLVEAIVAFAAALMILAAGATRSIARSALDYFGAAAPLGVSGWTRLGTLLMTLLALAMIFRYIPSVRPRPGWGAVLAGTVPATFLLNVATDLFGLLVTKSALASLYGTAASLVMFLLWVYYSAWVVLFGAEVCRAWGETTANAGPTSRRETITART